MDPSEVTSRLWLASRFPAAPRDAAPADEALGRGGAISGGASLGASAFERAFSSRGASQSEKGRRAESSRHSDITERGRAHNLDSRAAGERPHGAVARTIERNSEAARRDGLGSRQSDLSARERGHNLDSGRGGESGRAKERGAATVSRGSAGPPGSDKKAKVMQRGHGIAQLEKLRLQELRNSEAAQAAAGRPAAEAHAPGAGEGAAGAVPGSAGIDKAKEGEGTAGIGAPELVALTGRVISDGEIDPVLAAAPLLSDSLLQQLQHIQRLHHQQQLALLQHQQQQQERKAQEEQQQQQDAQKKASEEAQEMGRDRRGSRDAAEKLKKSQSPAGEDGAGGGRGSPAAGSKGREGAGHAREESAQGGTKAPGESPGKGGVDAGGRERQKQAQLQGQLSSAAALSALGLLPPRQQQSLSLSQQLALSSGLAGAPLPLSSISSSLPPSIPLPAPAPDRLLLAADPLLRASAAQRQLALLGPTALAARLAKTEGPVPAASLESGPLLSAPAVPAGSQIVSASAAAAAIAAGRASARQSLQSVSDHIHKYRQELLANSWEDSSITSSLTAQLASAHLHHRQNLEHELRLQHQRLLLQQQLQQHRLHQQQQQQQQQPLHEEQHRQKHDQQQQQQLRGVAEVEKGRSAPQEEQRHGRAEPPDAKASSDSGLALKLGASQALDPSQAQTQAPRQSSSSAQVVPESGTPQGAQLGAHAGRTQAPGASWADQARAGSAGVLLGAPSLAAAAAAAAGAASAGSMPLDPAASAAVRDALQSQKSLLGLATMAAAGLGLRTPRSLSDPLGGPPASVSGALTASLPRVSEREALERAVLAGGAAGKGAMGPGPAQLALGATGAPAAPSPLAAGALPDLSALPPGVLSGTLLAGTAPSLSLDAALSSALLRMQSRQQEPPSGLTKRSLPDSVAARGLGLSAALWTSQGLQRALMSTEPLPSQGREGPPEAHPKREAAGAATTSLEGKSAQGGELTVGGWGAAKADAAALEQVAASASSALGVPVPSSSGKQGLSKGSKREREGERAGEAAVAEVALGPGSKRQKDAEQEGLGQAVAGPPGARVGALLVHEQEARNKAARAREQEAGDLKEGPRREKGKLEAGKAEADEGGRGLVHKEEGGAEAEAKAEGEASEGEGLWSEDSEGEWSEGAGGADLETLGMLAHDMRLNMARALGPATMQQLESIILVQEATFLEQVKHLHEAIERQRGMAVQAQLTASAAARGSTSRRLLGKRRRRRDAAGIPPLRPRTWALAPILGPRTALSVEASGPGAAAIGHPGPRAPLPLSSTPESTAPGTSPRLALGAATAPSEEPQGAPPAVADRGRASASPSPTTPSPAQGTSHTPASHSGATPAPVAAATPPPAAAIPAAGSGAGGVPMGESGPGQRAEEQGGVAQDEGVSTPSPMGTPGRASGGSLSSAAREQMLRAALDGPWSSSAREGTSPKRRRPPRQAGESPREEKACAPRPAGESPRGEKARAEPHWSLGSPLPQADSGTTHRHVPGMFSTEGRPPVPPAAAAAAQQLAEALAKSGKIGPTARRARAGSLGSPLASPLPSPAAKGSGDVPGSGVPETGPKRPTADHALPSRSPPLQWQHRKEPTREPEEARLGKQHRGAKEESPAGQELQGGTRSRGKGKQESPGPSSSHLEAAPAAPSANGSPSPAPNTTQEGLSLAALTATEAAAEEPLGAPAADAAKGGCLDLNEPGEREGASQGRRAKPRAAEPGEVPAQASGEAGRGSGAAREGASDQRSSHDMRLGLGLGPSPSKRALGAAPRGPDSGPTEAGTGEGRLGFSLQLSFSALGTPPADVADGKQGKEAGESNASVASSHSKGLRKDPGDATGGGKGATDAEGEGRGSGSRLEEEAGLGLTL